MQSIINSIIKYRNLIIYLFLLLFSFNNLYNSSGLHYTKIGNISISVAGFSAKKINNIKSYFNLINENKFLKEENLILKKNEFNYSSNNLESESLMPNIVLANVIKNTIKNKKNFILIDKGANDGISLDSGVINSSGIVGIINNISPDYSSIISILNTDLKINVMVKRLSTIGSLSWDGSNPKRMSLSDIPTSNQIKIGDTIITGGMSFYFPKGIPIGIISSYETNETEGYFDVEVSLFNNFSSLNNVYVIDRLDNSQIKKLINN